MRIKRKKKSQRSKPQPLRLALNAACCDRSNPRLIVLYMCRFCVFKCWDLLYSISHGFLVRSYTRMVCFRKACSGVISSFNHFQTRNYIFAVSLVVSFMIVASSHITLDIFCILSLVRRIRSDVVHALSAYRDFIRLSYKSLIFENAGQKKTHSTWTVSSDFPRIFFRSPLDRPWQSFGRAKCSITPNFRMIPPLPLVGFRNPNLGQGKCGNHHLKLTGTQ